MLTTGRPHHVVQRDYDSGSIGRDSKPSLGAWKRPPLQLLCGLQTAVRHSAKAVRLQVIHDFQLGLSSKYPCYHSLSGRMTDLLLRALAEPSINLSLIVKSMIKNCTEGKDRFSDSVTEHQGDLIVRNCRCSLPSLE